MGECGGGGVKQSAGNWDVEHSQICRANNVQWPFDEILKTPSIIQDAGLRDREYEVACMMDVFWPPHKVPGGRSSIESVDFSPATSRVMKAHLHEDTKVVKTPAEHKQSTAWGPWHQGLCTQIGSGKILIR